MLLLMLIIFYSLHLNIYSEWRVLDTSPLFAFLTTMPLRAMDCLGRKILITCYSNIPNNH